MKLIEEHRFIKVWMEVGRVSWTGSEVREGARSNLQPGGGCVGRRRVMEADEEEEEEGL